MQCFTNWALKPLTMAIKVVRSVCPLGSITSRCSVPNLGRNVDRTRESGGNRSYLSIRLSVNQWVSPSDRQEDSLSVCLSVCLSVSQSVSLSVRQSENQFKCISAELISHITLPYMYTTKKYSYFPNSQHPREPSFLSPLRNLPTLFTPRFPPLKISLLEFWILGGNRNEICGRIWWNEIFSKGVRPLPYWRLILKIR